jgi:acetoin utilization deacetylase AcuC-like enzyme
MPVNIYTHPDFLKHDMGHGHPESPQRLKSILTALQNAPHREERHFIEAPQATVEQLARVHDKAYIEKLFSIAPEEGTIWLDADTAMNPFTLSAALHASGAMIAAVDDVFQGKTTKAFCLVRPPGHHAEPDRAMGFCFFNHIAVGVAHALATYHCQRIAIVDFDVHHGNGTESMFLNDPRVFFWSSFQHPFYPGTHLSGKPAHIHLRPLSAGTQSPTYRTIITNELIPLLNAFQPECIFISAGFDAHRNDPLANIALETQDYGFIMAELRKVADSYSQGRLIGTLEGGYNLEALSASVLACITQL